MWVVLVGKAKVKNEERKKQNENFDLLLAVKQIPFLLFFSQEWPIFWKDSLEDQGLIVRDDQNDEIVLPSKRSSLFFVHSPSL